MQMVRVFSCGKTELSPSASITTFPFQAHTLNFVMHWKTGKTSFTVVKTGGLKSMPKRDKDTYAGKWCNSDFHWKKHQGTIYKKAIVLKGHEWSLSNESAGGNVQEAPREIGTNDLMVDEWTLGYFLMTRENQITDSPDASWCWDRFMGKRVLRQTMLAIAVIYGSDLYKKCTPFDDIFQLFKMDRGALSPVWIPFGNIVPSFQRD